MRSFFQLAKLLRTMCDVTSHQSTNSTNQKSYEARLLCMPCQNPTTINQPLLLCNNNKKSVKCINQNHTTISSTSPCTTINDKKCCSNKRVIPKNGTQYASWGKGRPVQAGAETYNTAYSELSNTVYLPLELYERRMAPPSPASTHRRPLQATPHNHRAKT